MSGKKEEERESWPTRFLQARRIGARLAPRFHRDAHARQREGAFDKYCFPWTLAKLERRTAIFSLSLPPLFSSGARLNGDSVASVSTGGELERLSSSKLPFLSFPGSLKLKIEFSTLAGEAVDRNVGRSMRWPLANASPKHGRVEDNGEGRRGVYEGGGGGGLSGIPR